MSNLSSRNLFVIMINIALLMKFMKNHLTVFRIQDIIIMKSLLLKNLVKLNPLLKKTLKITLLMKICRTMLKLVLMTVELKMPLIFFLKDEIVLPKFFDDHPIVKDNFNVFLFIKLLEMFFKVTVSKIILKVMQVTPFIICDRMI